VPWAKLEGRQLAEPASEATWNKRIDKEQKRRSKRAAKLKDMGYEFEAPKIKAVEDVEKAGETAAPTEPEVVTTTLEAGAASVDKAAVTSLEETKDVSQAPAEEKAPAKTRHAKQAKKTAKKVEV
jgi:nucleolar protein 15